MIEFHKVSFTYPGHASEHDRVLYNIDVRFEKGGFYCIVGSNGSGKSTMACLINGINYPYSGKIFVDGTEVIPDNFLKIRQKAGYVFQNPDNQIVSTTVDSEVAFALENLGVSYENMHRAVPEILKFVELSEYENTPPHMLSGGQKQRLAIASVVVTEPDYIIFDEPTSMLDRNGKDEVNSLIRKLHRSGRTVILITHDIEEIVQSDQVVVLSEGRIIARCTPFEFFSDAALCLRAGFVSIPDYVKIGIDMGIKDLNRENIIKIFSGKMMEEHEKKDRCCD
ncbi:MAG: ATP-binding cassette domain-containing protein [Candidatus Muiribacteriaceae bacterium]